MRKLKHSLATAKITVLIPDREYSTEKMLNGSGCSPGTGSSTDLYSFCDLIYSMILSTTHTS